MATIDPNAPVAASDIADYYQALLGREPDPEGLAWYQQKIAQQLSHYDIYRELIGSEEWHAMPAVHRLRNRLHFMQAFGLTEQLLAERHWFHSVALADGTMTAGTKPHDILRSEEAIVFRDDLTGKSVLDIGAWDGYFSFAAERRGAASVLSTDHFSWSGPGWGDKAGYDLLHCALDSACASLDVDVFALDPQQLGQFDVVLFLGVLYHLKDPLGGLEKAAAMSRDLLIIETETTHNYSDEPLMRYYVGSEMNNDTTNYWAPNLACVQAMLKDLGYSQFDSTPNFPYRHKHKATDGDRLFRYIIHARR